jgi:hypothetical protein
MWMNSMIGCVHIPIPSAGKPKRIRMVLKSTSTANAVVGDTWGRRYDSVQGNTRSIKPLWDSGFEEVHIHLHHQWSASTDQFSDKASSVWVKLWCKEGMLIMFLCDLNLFVASVFRDRDWFLVFSPTDWDWLDWTDWLKLLFYFSPISLVRRFSSTNDIRREIAAVRPYSVLPLRTLL